jgi:pilus assembly protein Flp/PilA
MHKKPRKRPEERSNAVLLSLLRDESGQDLVEYALLAALIGLGATATMKTLATTLSNALSTIGSRLSSAV